jgi:hypothetical protein
METTEIPSDIEDANASRRNNAPVDFRQAASQVVLFHPLFPSSAASFA